MSPGSERLSSVLVRAVAEARGVAPADLSLRLYEEVDADALDALWAHEGGAWTLEFELDGHAVEVDAAGTVRVDGRAFAP